jgi:hypothetical protein
MEPEKDNVDEDMDMLDEAPSTELPAGEVPAEMAPLVPIVTARQTMPESDSETADTEEELDDDGEIPEAGLSAEDEDEIFGVDDEDVLGEGPDDMSDVLDVSDEDVMGPGPSAPKRRKPRPARSQRRYQPPTSMGSMGY